MPFCTQCGHANSDDSRFCSNCGSALRSSGSTSGTSGPAGGPVSGDVTSTINLQSLDPSRDSSDSPDPALSPADQAAVEALPSGSALLVVRRGPNSGSRFLLDGEVTTAGRHPESDIFLDDVTVSRRHAEFVRAGNDYAVRDVGSLNGTYVNRERIEQVVLTGGDEVQIGKYRLVFFDASHRGAGGSGSRS